MKKKTLFCGLVVFLSGIIFGQGLNQLAASSAKGIHEFFSRENLVRASIVTFDNFSGLSDMTAHKFYQLLVSKLESDARIRFTDLMINFNQNRGEFNLGSVSGLNYLLYVKLIRNREKLGAGLVVFSKTLDKIVYVQYKEVRLNAGEKQILTIREFGFKSLGFSKVVEMDARQGLLDIKTVQVPSGAYQYFFYYPERIEVFKLDNNQLVKVSSLPLQWGRPYYPVLEFEGKLSVFKIKEDLFLTAGGNFSPRSQVFRFQNDQWEAFSTVEFVPFRLIQVNQQYYLAGSKYDLGKNYFVNKIFLKAMESSDFKDGKIFEKKIPEFYALDFASDKGALMSIHMIDKEYRYRFFASDFEERTTENNKRGSCLNALGGDWLAISDYSRGTDTLFFYKIENGSRNLVYQNRISGEIFFISAGRWKSFLGFWILIKRVQKNDTGFYLEFWRKGEESRIDPEAEKLRG